jgi:hypothetical protein
MASCTTLLLLFRINKNNDLESRGQPRKREPFCAVYDPVNGKRLRTRHTGPVVAGLIDPAAPDDG